MKADFVIIGAGSAGCAMAYRLSEDEVNTVIVIEYGGSDMGPLIQMPAALSYPMNMKAYDWGFQSEPEPHLDNRKLATPRGKVLGGSSSINGMVYVRGHAKDYDYWEQSGANGWSYADVLPYFKRMENWRSGGHGGDKSWRGRKGPLHVSRGPRKNPLFKAFVKAGQQAGYETTEDYNGEKQEGFGPMEQTVYKGRRWSAANAYLHSALKRKNCKIVRAFARKVPVATVNNLKSGLASWFSSQKQESELPSDVASAGIERLNSPNSGKAPTRDGPKSDTITSILSFFAISADKTCCVNDGSQLVTANGSGLMKT